MGIGKLLPIPSLNYGSRHWRWKLPEHAHDSDSDPDGDASKRRLFKNDHSGRKLFSAFVPADA